MFYSQVNLMSNESNAIIHAHNLSICLQTITAPTQLNAVLTSKELEAIVTRGHSCEHGECSIDDVDSLVAELQEQQHNLHERINEMNMMIKSLEVLNDKDDRDHDEVRATVESIFRLFSMGAKSHDFKPTGMATGYPGDVGSGPSDAYKSLNPKPWKKSP